MLTSLVAAATIIACLAVLAFFLLNESEAERYTSGVTPAQFRRELEPDLLDDYAGVFGVAHNSGDSIRTTREAVSKGADVIEIDLVAVNGTLRAAHDVPLPFIGDRFFRGPKLEQVWEAAAGVEVVKLDLKQTNSAFLDLVFEFLADHDEYAVIVSTGNVDALAAFAERAPAVIRLYSIPNPREFHRLESDPDLIVLVDGVSMRHQLFDEDRAAWLQANGLISLAWTVNDAPRMNELVRLGVDAITTDNLAILELLGGQQRGEATLIRR